MWITALILGITGSFHCVGMCSPLVMAVTNMNPSAVWNRLIYNIGRIFTYCILGALVASFGFVLPVFKFQNLVSILLGIILLLIGIGALNTHIPILSSIIGRFTIMLKNVFAKFLKQKNTGSILLLGAVNGLLPCGLVFAALTYCLTLRSPLEGLSFMLFFGVATLPVMLGFTAVTFKFVKRFHFNFKYFTTGMLIVSGIILIARVFIVHLPHKPSLQEGVIDIVLCR